MKKFLVIPIMFLYMLAVSGIMVHIHYCSGNMESVNLFGKGKSCTGHCDEKPGKPDNCCNDKVFAAKVSDDHSFMAFQFKVSLAESVLPAVINYNNISIAPAANTKLSLEYKANAPPGLWQNIPLYKLHSRITYYG